MKIYIRKFSKRYIKDSVKIIKETLGNYNSKLARADFLEGLYPKINEYAYLDRFVALENKKVIAIAGIYRLITHPKDFAGICWYAVSPKYQNKGIGSRLMREMEIKARKRQKRIFFAWAAKKAVIFYKKFGFKISKIHLKPKESRILMIKRLK